MSSLYPRKQDTLTARNIVDSYVFAYQSIHNTQPQCEHIDGRWFIVDGIRRDRHWIVLEIERLRQEALSSALQNEEEKPTSHIFKMIRRLSRL